jgi:RND family efflux transporter MFP subunit
VEVRARRRRAERNVEMSRARSRGAALLALAAAVAGCSRPDAQVDEARAAQVLVNASDVVRAESQRLESGVSFTGELVPAEVVEITARFEGDLAAVLVREGQSVRRGQALARYRPRDVRDAWQSADAELAAAQAALAAAQNSHRRAERLLAAGAASPSELEAARAQLAAAEARLKAAQAQHNRATEDADRLDVPSPITGAVSAVHVHSGERTLVGDRMMTLVDTSTLELSATVPSEALAHVQRGTRIEFRLQAFPGELFHGQVDRINPTTEPGTRQVRIYMRLPNPDGRLVGGMFASGRIISEVRERATTAPLAVLRREGADLVVYRLQRGTARRVGVTTGLVDEAAGVVELVGGVSPGDSLLTGVLPGLRDGAPVRILGPQADSAAASAVSSAAAPARGR